MYKLTIAVFATLASVAFCVPADIQVLHHAHDGPNPDGSYSYAYETSDGVRVSQVAEVPDARSGQTVPIVRGSFSYAVDGVDYAVQYVADANGYQPVGAHLPVAPAIPEAIARAIEWIKAHPAPEAQKK